MSPSNLDLKAPLTMDASNLPDGASPDLELVQVTPEEAKECFLLNSISWRGPLSIEAFLRREAHLASQEATVNGGLTGWILVDKRDVKSPRTVLSACESLRKRAFVARRGGVAKEVLAFGVGSVYCREEYRGKGYAVRMMKELSKKLESWQQEGGTKTDFSVLYSDIGKKFYAKNGWIPYPSAHISLSPSTADAPRYPLSEPLKTSDLPRLCQRDKEMLKTTVETFPQSGPEFRVALIPDSQTMNWHHAREEFLAKELLGRAPEVKGAIVKSANNRSVWCIWSRVFGQGKKGDTLYILRLFVEDEDCLSQEPSSTQSVQAVASCLAAARIEASTWGMNEVEVWNPSSTALAGARLLDASTKVVHRDQESIACLNWYGDHIGTQNVQWVANEKFGWC